MKKTIVDSLLIFKSKQLEVALPMVKRVIIHFGVTLILINVHILLKKAPWKVVSLLGKSVER